MICIMIFTHMNTEITHLNSEFRENNQSVMININSWITSLLLTCQTPQIPTFVNFLLHGACTPRINSVRLLLSSLLLPQLGE